MRCLNSLLGRHWLPVFWCTELCLAFRRDLLGPESSGVGGARLEEARL